MPALLLIALVIALWIAATILRIKLYVYQKKRFNQLDYRALGLGYVLDVFGKIKHRGKGYARLIYANRIAIILLAAAIVILILDVSK